MKSKAALLGFTMAMAMVVPWTSHAGPCEDVIVHEPALAPRGRVQAVAVAGVRMKVLLPPLYTAIGRRYPVLYLLHGFSMNEDSWLDFGNVERFTERLTDADQAIVVMPTPDWLGIWADVNDKKMFETAMVHQVIPSIDARYRTIADRGHRAVSGLSAGGISAELLAGHHPELFAAMGAFSGTPVDWSDPVAATAVFGLDRMEWACATAPTGSAAADPTTQTVRNEDMNAIALAPNYRGLGIYFSSGTGVPCDPRDLHDIAFPSSPAATGFQLGEAGVAAGAGPFDQALTELGIPHTAELRSCGIHSWRYFAQDFRTFWPIMVRSFGTSTPPALFGHRRAISRFSAWGWVFRADPSRAEEFLTVDRASRFGLTLTGSGRTFVTTASYFRSHAIVVVTGAIERSVVADRSGRISFHVDLGWPHQNVQYSPVARALEAAGGYWTTRSVTFASVAS